MDAREKKRSTKELLNILYCENGSYRIGELLDIIKELKTREEVDINIVLSFEECIFNVYQERKDKEDEMISLEEIRQKLRNKGIEEGKLEESETKVEKPVFKTSEEYQEYLKIYTDIRGWLCFFLVVMVLGGVRDAVYIPSHNFPGIYDEEYKNGIFSLLAMITISVEWFVMIGYIVYAFAQRNANAVFWARVCLLFYLFFVVIAVLVSGGKWLGSVVLPVILLLFLSRSKNVKEVIPKDYRKVTKLDWTFVIIIVVLPILFIVLDIIKNN